MLKLNQGLYCCGEVGGGEGAEKNFGSREAKQLGGGGWQFLWWGGKKLFSNPIPKQFCHSIP